MSTESQVSKSDEKQSFAEYQAVAKTLQFDIDGAKAGDGKISRPAFFDHAHVSGTINGNFSSLDADTFTGHVSDLGPSADLQSHIAWIDISGPAAVAKVEFINWSGIRFTDFIVLFKKDDEWKISAKVYDAHSNR